MPLSESRTAPPSLCNLHTDTHSPRTTNPDTAAMRLSGSGKTVLRRMVDVLLAALGEL